MSEGGSASLLAVSLLAVLALVFAVGLDALRLIDIHTQARTAADAAALAAAVATHRGPSPTGEAQRLARLNGASMLSCRCPPDRSFRPRSVTVIVEMRVDRWLLPVRRVLADASAEYDPLA